MRLRPSLRTRLALAFAAFGGAVSLVLAAGLAVVTHDLGQRLIDQTLAAELEDYMARRARNPLSRPPETLTLRGFVADGALEGLPAAVRGLPPGRHEVEIEGVPWRVAVAEARGERYYLLFDETRQAARELRFLAWLVAGVVAMTLLSAAGGLWAARRAIAPVSELARKVAGADPGEPPRLAQPGAADDEVAELARAFDRHLARLHDFIERERFFTADVSHELRTPLAVIQGAAEVLRADPALGESQSERLARIERAARDMAELIRALLLMAREEEAGAISEAECDAAAVVRESVERHRHLLARRPTTLEVDVAALPRLAAEPVLLAIVVGNLVRNAFAHTESGVVSVRLGADRLEVRDTGSGIRAEEVGRVFQRHYKGAASRGAGIGLSLVKRICDRYGWEITLESREGEGTSASLRFGAPAPP